MNKIVNIIAIGFALLSYNNIFAAVVSNSSTFETNCPGANNTLDFYIPNSQSSLEFYPTDLFQSPTESFIRNTESEISIWRNSINSYSACTNWYRLSNFVPGDSSPYGIFITNSCLLNKAPKTTANLPSMQIVFKIAYLESTGIDPSGTSTYYYYPYIGGGFGPQTYAPNQSYRNWSAMRIHSNECLNINAHWCGDGVRDGSDGEVCDPNDPARVGFGTNGCSASCQPLGGGGGSATCENLTMNGGNTQTTFIAPATVSFLGTGAGGLGGNPIYRLILKDNATNGTIATYTGTTGAFTHTFSTGIGFTATLYIDNTLYGTVGGEYGCKRTGTVTSTNGGHYCGDGVVDTGEACDLGPLNGTPGVACSATCTTGTNGGGYCGNDIKESGEECDGTDVPDGKVCDVDCKIKSTTGPGGRAVCGDGIVQRPNSDNVMETCDTTASWCRDCLMADTQPGGGGTVNITITNPGLNPNTIHLKDYSILAGDGVPLFGLNDIIGFSTDTNLYLGGKSFGLINNAGSYIRGNSIPGVFPDGAAVGDIDYFVRYETDGSGNILYDANGYPIAIYRTEHNSRYYKLFDGTDINNIYGSTSSFGPFDIYKTTTTSDIYPSHGTNNIYVKVGYFETAIPVRISKNIVSNTAGGNAYIYNPVGFDVNYIVKDFMDELASGNFTTTSINRNNNGDSGNLSGNSTSYIAKNYLNDKIDSSDENEKNKIDKFNTDDMLSAFSVHISDNFDFISKTEKLGDNDNIRVLKNGDMTIDTSVIGDSLELSKVKTIIIENGNLNINRDMIYKSSESSYAFIIKNGNVIISKNVKDVSGVFVVMNGKYLSNGGNTALQLNVDGSLYGDVSSLSKDRTFVRGTSGSTSVTSGIIINYSNRALKNPPPMLLNFIEQFNSKKIAK